MNPDVFPAYRVASRGGIDEYRFDQGSNISWEQANRHCGGHWHLVSINDIEEMTNLYTWLLTAHLTNEYVYIGES